MQYRYTMKKNKVILTAVISALLLGGCADSQAPDISTEPIIKDETAATTTKKISAAENQPEDTISPANTSKTQVVEPGQNKPDGFPDPYPSAKVEDKELSEKLKNLVGKAEIVESLLYGKNTLVPLIGAEKDGFKLIDGEYAKTVEALTAKMYESFTSYYWQDAYGSSGGELLKDIIKETKEGIWLSCADLEKRFVIEANSTVITEKGEDYALVTALGKKDKEFIWRTYRAVYDSNSGWKIGSYSDTGITGELAVFNKLLIESRDTLDKIFGNAAPVKTGENWNTQLITIEDDIYGNGFYNALEIEPFMTVEQMRQFMRDTFTSEIAESYISLYINRTFLEKDGKLYIISGSVLPQTGEFSLEDYTNISTGTYSVTSKVSWTGSGGAVTIPITVAYEDGKWKLDTRLPMREDRIIQ